MYTALWCVQEGLSVLSVASRLGNVGIVQKLLECGAKVSSQTIRIISSCPNISAYLYVIAVNPCMHKLVCLVY